jgi:hypothetical protein
MTADQSLENIASPPRRLHLRRIGPYAWFLTTGINRGGNTHKEPDPHGAASRSPSGGNFGGGLLV